LGKVLSLHAMGIPGAVGAPSTQAQVQAPAGLPPAILAGRSQSKPVLGKGPLVDFQIVREEGRGGRRESQTLGKVGGEYAGEKGRGGRTGRCSCHSGQCRRGIAVRGMGDISQVTEIRGSAASPHAAASVPHRGTSLLQASRAGCPAIRGGGQRGVVGAAQSRLVLVNPDELLAII